MNTPPIPNALGALGTYMRSPRLTQRQRTKIAWHLQNRFGIRKCDLCQHTEWAIGENLVSPMPLLMDHLNRTYSIDYSVIHASVHLVCLNCGNTKLMHLAQLGFDPFAVENQ